MNPLLNMLLPPGVDIDAVMKQFLAAMEAMKTASDSVTRIEAKLDRLIAERTLPDNAICDGRQETLNLET